MPETDQPEDRTDAGQSDADLDDALRAMEAAAQENPQLVEDVKMVMESINSTAHDPTGAPE